MVIDHINKQFCSTLKCWIHLGQNKREFRRAINLKYNHILSRIMVTSTTKSFITSSYQFCHANDISDINYRIFMFQHNNVSLTSQRRCCTSFLPARLLSTSSHTYKANAIGKEHNASIKSISKNHQLTKISRYPELRKLFALALPEKNALAGGIAFLIISSSITMAVPFALGHVIDVIYTLDPVEMKRNLNQVCLALIGIFVTGSMANFGRIYLMNMAGQRITKALRSLVFASIMKQETAFFDHNKTGELVNRLSSDTTIVSQAVTMNISDGLRSTVMVIAGIGMMFYMSSELAIVGLSIVPPTALMAKYYGKYLQKITMQVQDTLAASTQVAEEKIANIRTVRAFAQELKETKEYDKNVDNVLKLTHKESLARGIFFALTGLSGNVVVLSVLYYGGTLVTESSLTVGQLTSFLLYAAYVGISLGGLSSFYSELNKGIGASTRLFQLMERVPSIAVHSGKTIPYDVVKGKLTFQGVHFAYPTRLDFNILNNFNLEVPSGSIIAVVGASGSGKSTIGNLLLRLYDPQHGDILLDDQPIQEFDPTWFRSLVASVSQEPTLFSTTILENILYGCPDPSTISQDDIVEASKEANALNFIEAFPDKFNTLVGERGVLLSGGQKQRIAIARAIISKPKILLLDEATSALDSESESLVQDALEKLMKNKTVITIAHRLSTIRNSTQIAVLHHGSVAELGPYEDLMQLDDGIFRKLVEKQTITR